MQETITLDESLDLIQCSILYQKCYIINTLKICKKW